MEIEPKIMSQVKSILGEFGNKYLTSEGFLRRNNVINDLDKFDCELMTKLFKDPLIHKNYVEKIADTEVFKLNQFIEMFEYKEFWEDSYTKYTNKIGLTANGKFIDESADVVLDFPFKDTVLKADMAKDDLDRDESADEPFLNETIAKPEIDELLEPKIFANIKKYDQNGAHKTSNYSNQDNLIIKGNNLIALYSLKKRYTGSIQSIFLDPPYYFKTNKQSDSFSYNSNFKLSSWLTFMKNRLTVAKELLSDDGILVMTIGIDGNSYLRLLTDSIFQVDQHPKNFIGEISWRKTDNQSNIGDFANVSDRILLYRKSSNTKLFKLPLSEKAKKEYSYSDQIGKYRRANILDLTRGRYTYKIITPDNTVLEGPWMISNGEYKELEKQNRIHWPKNGKKIPYGKIYLKDSLNKGQISSDFWDGSYGTNQRGADEQKALFGKRLFEFPKPEKLLENLLSLTSNEGDLVLDFFMGSATTQAVAMKMHRHFIGIEQMDYINTVSVPRLQKVIAGEQGGISKDVGWHGGGSFVYAELMEKNQGYLKDLLAAKDMNELDIVYKRMKVGADFDFRVDLDKYENDAERKALPFEEQKQLLVKLLDKNQLYYNFNNIDDADVRDLISDKDYQFNQSFYGKRD